jgi:O-antigen ligase
MVEGVVSEPGGGARRRRRRTQAIHLPALPHGLRLTRDMMAALVVTLVAFVALVPWGSNTASLSALASMAYLVAAGAVIALIGGRAPVGFWGRLFAPALLLIAAGVWAGLGLVPEYGRAPGSGGDWTAPFRTAALAPWISVTPDGALLELCKLLGVAAFGLAGTLVGADPRRLKACAWCLLTAGGLYALVALSLHHADPFAVFGVSKGFQEGRFTGTFLNPNVAGCLFAMLSALTAGFLRSEINRMSGAPSAYRRSRIPHLALLALLLFFFVAACALTRSRAALAFAALAVVILALPRRSAKPQPRRSARSRIAVSWSWLVVGALLLGIAIAGAGALHRTADFQESALGRLHAYGIFSRQTAESPWFGYGLGAFPTIALQGIEPKYSELLWNFRAAHNALLQAALEGGVPYLILLVAAIAVWLAPGFRAPAPAGVRSIRLGLLLAAGVCVGCAMVDIVLNVPSMAALTALLAGLYAGAGYLAPPPTQGEAAAA